MSSSCMGKELPKEKQFGVKVCRKRKCPDLQNDPEYPKSPQMCAVTHGMPGAMSICVKEMPAEQFILQISGQLNSSPYSAPRPGIKNCPDVCPYKIRVDGFNKANKPAKIGKCALTGKTLGDFGTCPCNVLGNPQQENQISRLHTIVNARLRNKDPTVGLCNMGVCPDGKDRGAPDTDDDRCPVIKMPYGDISPGMGCPLWRIPAKLLPVPDKIPDMMTKGIADSFLDAVKTKTPDSGQKEKIPSRNSAQKEKKKEAVDPICEACFRRIPGGPPDYACTSCKEEQEKRGRRLWVSRLTLNTLHLGDMKILGDQVPDNSVDMIFTDPPYLKELWEDAYGSLGQLAARVLKTYGFLFTYAPQTRLPQIMEMLECSGDRVNELTYLWIVPSLNEGQSTAKNHQRNAICLHKPILIYQKVPHIDGKYREPGDGIRGARRCFTDVVRGLRQKRFHPWQQSIHDPLGILDRFMDQGEILLDPFAGTGTSLKAANLLGMDWIGFEINPETHAIAVLELQQEPLSLGTFGIEATAAEHEREPVVHKDIDRQVGLLEQAPEAALSHSFNTAAGPADRAGRHSSRAAPGSASCCSGTARNRPRY